MSRKQVISKEGLIDGAFRLVEEQGINAMSARNLAKFCGCSTQPIFRIYNTMDEMKADLMDKCFSFFSQYVAEFKSVSEKPFVNLGMSYIGFAKKYPHLFEVIFVRDNGTDRNMYDLINGGDHGFVTHEFRKLGHMSPDSFSLLFMKVWIFIHGAACMVIKDDFDMTDSDLVSLLEDTITAFYE